MPDSYYRCRQSLAWRPPKSRRRPRGHHRAESATDDPTFTVLPSTDAAPGLARRHVSAACSDVPPHVVEAAKVLASELVTNAVRHGNGRVGLRVAVEEAAVQIEVSDDGREMPEPGNGWRPDSEGGRGLMIVSALADDWGSAPRGGEDGKTVWARLHLT